ncbi:hypothetical protein CVU37_08980 [candidate division BRC1 bacterium HGW-BRC1-1]|nr:MAG: hypothetical protein CVU37_08980 [candidate division BRC1 bacterium HGW-BRC1-1]
MAASAPAGAGGYLAVTSGGVPYKWAPPITLNYDLGPLSATQNNAAGVALVNSAVAVWATANVPTCALSFTVGTPLSEDHGDGLGTDPNYDETVADGITPVIFDQSGILTSGLFAGAQNQVLGFAGPTFVVGTTIVEGQVVLNGLFIDGNALPSDVTTTEFQGVITHEVGHMLNLDHALFNGSYGFPGVPDAIIDLSAMPTMYPFVHGDIGDLEDDDRAWISSLYPTGAFISLHSISGQVISPTSTTLNGVNVIARQAASPKRTVSCVSGYLDGTPTITPDGIYMIPGLDPATTWTLEFEQIPTDFSGGSSVGPIDPPLTLPAPAEYINEPLVETNSDPIEISTSFELTTGSRTGINAYLNASYPAAINVSEVDPPGFTFPGEAMEIKTAKPGSVMTISGNALQGEGGNVDLLGGDPIEDWYAFKPNTAMRITRITLQPAAGDDSDLYLCTFDGSTLKTADASLNIGQGVTDEITGVFDTTLFPNQTAYIGVSTYTGEPGGNYTLTIEGTFSSIDSVALDSIPGGAIDAGSGSFTIKGRGFKNANGAPSVTLGDPLIQVTGVTFVNSTQLNVSINRLSGWIPSVTTVKVQNQGLDGGYAGRLFDIGTVPVSLTSFEVE